MPTSTPAPTASTATPGSASGDEWRSFNATSWASGLQGFGGGVRSFVFSLIGLEPQGFVGDCCLARGGKMQQEMMQGQPVPQASR